MLLTSERSALDQERGVLTGNQPASRHTATVRQDMRAIAIQRIYLLNASEKAFH